LRLRQRHRRGDPPVPEDGREQRRRSRYRRPGDQPLRELQLRSRPPAVPTNMAGLHHAPDDGDRDRRWPHQLQPAQRLGAGRAQEAIARGTTQQEQMVREWTDNLRSAYPDWGRERWQRRLERKLRRRAEREARIANASLFEGYVWLLGAIVLFIIALSSLPFLWWLIFPAAGLGARGTRVIARHSGVTKATVPVDAP